MMIWIANYLLLENDTVLFKFPLQSDDKSNKHFQDLQFSAWNFHQEKVHALACFYQGASYQAMRTELCYSYAVYSQEL